jgi:translation initiation factor 1
MEERRLVYSTDGGAGGRPTSARGKPTRRPPQGPAKPAFPNDGIVRVSRERANRGGRTVTVIRGLPPGGSELAARLTELKRLCGAGGVLRDGVLEVQGDHRDLIVERLSSLGYRVKLAGG